MPEHIGNLFAGVLDVASRFWDTAGNGVTALLPLEKRAGRDSVQEGSPQLMQLVAHFQQSCAGWIKHGRPPLP